MAYRVIVTAVVANPADRDWLMNELRRRYPPLNATGVEVTIDTIPESTGPVETPTLTGRWLVIGQATFPQRNDANRVKGDMIALGNEVISDARILSHSWDDFNV